MTKIEQIEKFYDTFKSYKKTSKLQTEFLELYARKDSLDELEKKKFDLAIKSLEAIEKLAKNKRAMNKLVKNQGEDSRKKATQANIITGAALNKAAVSSSQHKDVYEQALVYLIEENFISKDDVEKVQNHLNNLKNKKPQDKSEDNSNHGNANTTDFSNQQY